MTSGEMTVSGQTGTSALTSARRNIQNDNINGAAIRNHKTQKLKPCPHCRRKVRLSHKSETVAVVRAVATLRHMEALAS